MELELSSQSISESPSVPPEIFHLPLLIFLVSPQLCYVLVCVLCSYLRKHMDAEIYSYTYIVTHTYIHTYMCVNVGECNTISLQLNSILMCRIVLFLCRGCSFKIHILKIINFHFLSNPYFYCFSFHASCTKDISLYFIIDVEVILRTHIYTSYESY